MKSNKPENIDDYIARYPVEVQERMQKIRALIRKVAPDAIEGISYAIPAFKLGGKNLIFFAAYNNHIAIYPRPQSLKAELAPYAVGKGTIQFPHTDKLPITLITKVVKARVSERS